MASSVLITGGTGGLGAAVTEAFLDGGWRVVVPIYDDAERERVPAHERLVLEPADLLDADSARAVTALAAGDESGAAARRRQPRRRLRDGRARPRDAGRGLRAPAAAEPAPDVPRLPGRDRALLAAGGGVDRLRARRGRRCNRSPARPATSPPRPRCWRSSTCSPAEYRDDDIRVNAILPSVIDTPANRRSMPDADVARWVTPGADRRRRALPLRGRLGRHQRRARAGLRQGLIRPATRRAEGVATRLARAARLHAARRRAERRNPSATRGTVSAVLRPRRILLALCACALAVSAAPAGATPPLPTEQIAAGVTAGGVDLAGLTVDQAAAKLESVRGSVEDGVVTVLVADVRFKLKTADARRRARHDPDGQARALRRPRGRRLARRRRARDHAVQAAVDSVHRVDLQAPAPRAARRAGDHHAAPGQGHALGARPRHRAARARQARRQGDRRPAPARGSSSRGS